MSDTLKAIWTLIKLFVVIAFPFAMWTAVFWVGTSINNALNYPKYEHDAEVRTPFGYISGSEGNIFIIGDKYRPEHNLPSGNHTIKATWSYYEKASKRSDVLLLTQPVCGPDHGWAAVNARLINKEMFHGRTIRLVEPGCQEYEDIVRGRKT
jgi:hypothetical protein